MSVRTQLLGELVSYGN